MTDLTEVDYAAVRALVCKIEQFYAEHHSIPANRGRRTDRRIRGLQRPGPKAPGAELLAIYNYDTKEWHVADAGAWLQDRDDAFSVYIGSNTRTFSVYIGSNTRSLDVEARVRAIFGELGDL